MPHRAGELPWVAVWNSLWSAVVTLEAKSNYIKTYKTSLRLDSSSKLVKRRLKAKNNARLLPSGVKHEIKILYENIPRSIYNITVNTGVLVSTSSGPLVVVAGHMTDGTESNAKIETKITRESREHSVSQGRPASPLAGYC